VEMVEVLASRHGFSSLRDGCRFGPWAGRLSTERTKRTRRQLTTLGKTQHLGFGGGSTESSREGSRPCQRKKTKMQKTPRIRGVFCRRRCNLGRASRSKNERLTPGNGRVAGSAVKTTAASRGWAHSPSALPDGSRAAVAEKAECFQGPLRVACSW
jgi:hypothetical protein